MEVVPNATESQEIQREKCFQFRGFLQQMFQIYIFLVLVISALSARINILTSIVINQLPFQQTLTCTDCVQPVRYNAQGLPQFMDLEGDTLKIVGSPEPGQYHISISMTDSVNQNAHIFVIVVILDQISTQTTTEIHNTTTTISLSSPQTYSNLTGLLMETYSDLTVQQIKIQNTLKRQSDLNTKISNLLILIRRYSNTWVADEARLAELSKQLEDILPSQSGLNQQIILNQNRFERNQQAIFQLLTSIREMRSQVAQKRKQQESLVSLVQKISNQVHEKMIEKAKLQSTLQIRQQLLNQQMENVTTKVCNYNAIEYQKELLTQADSNKTVLQENLNEANSQVSDLDDQIQDLKDKLKEAESRRFEALMKKYEYTAQLNHLEKQKNSSLTILQTLTVECDSNQIVNPNSLEQMRQVIRQLNEKIQQIQKYLQNVLYVQIEDSQKEGANLIVDIQFLNGVIDQNIKEVTDFYTQNTQIDARLTVLREQKKRIDMMVQELQRQISELMAKTDKTNIALEDAKQMLGKALEEKEQNDKDVQQIFLDNLDIIKSIHGKGNYKFDLQRLSSISGINIQTIQIHALYQIDIQGISSTLSCKNSISFYGIGVVHSINKEKGIVSISNGTPGIITDLIFPECSINLSTSESHTLVEGDAICWKGYRQDNQWIITESIFFPVDYQMI